MAAFAYDSPQKENAPIKADTVSSDKTELTYYCSCKLCKARMHLCSFKASNKKPPYYSSYPHEEHCPECMEHKANHQNRFDRTAYDDTQFDSVTFLQQLMEPPIVDNPQTKSETAESKNTKTSTTPKTAMLPYQLATVYRLCRGSNIDEPFGNNPKDSVGLFLADSRSNRIFTKGIYGIRMVECYFREAESSKYLCFHYPLDPTAPHQHDIVLQIEDEQLKRSLWTKLCKGGERPIVILGDWYTKFRKDSYCACKVVSLNQIYIPPKRRKGQDSKATTSS